MRFFYSEKTDIVYTFDALRLEAEDFYKFMNMPMPENWMDKLIKVYKLREVPHANCY